MNKYGGRDMKIKLSKANQNIPTELMNAIKSEKVFIASDLHFFRPKKIGKGEEWVEYWIKEINDKVSETDWLILLGDIVDFRDPTGKKDKEWTEYFLSRLNNKKVVLMRGNNDHLSDKDYYDAGYHLVTNRIDTDKFVISHYPLNIINKINIHGHIHGSKSYPKEFKTNNRIDVFYELHGGKILTLKDYLKNYKKGIYDGEANFEPDEEEVAERNNIYKGNINEASLLFSKPDILLNLDKFESGEIDRLFISGFHGSGKSTIGRELAESMNAKFIEMDMYQSELKDTYGKEVMKTKNLYAGKSDEKLAQKNYEDFVDKMVEKHGRCIFEGTHVLFMDFDYIKNYAVWIVNTSYIKSYIRAVARSSKPEAKELEIASGKKKSPHRFIKLNAQIFKRLSDLERKLKDESQLYTKTEIRENNNRVNITRPAWPTSEFAQDLKAIYGKALELKGEEKEAYGAARKYVTESNLFDNIRKKQARIAKGSGEKMKKSNQKGYPHHLEKIAKEANESMKFKLVNPELLESLLNEKLITPKKGEEKNDFISRFMSSKQAKIDFPENKQRVAVAFSQWERLKEDKFEVELLNQGEKELKKVVEADTEDEAITKTIDSFDVDVNNIKSIEKLKEFKIQYGVQSKPLNEAKERHPMLIKYGVEGFNKPKATPSHKTKSHLVVAKKGDEVKVVRFGAQGVKGSPKKDGESEAYRKRREGFVARHKAQNPEGMKDKFSPLYWANKVKW
jgi:calcineurin-like phosphoesterase family protein/shikimate kinase